MGNYNGIISDSIGAASISNGMWHSTTITLTPYRGTPAEILTFGKAANHHDACVYHRQKLEEAIDNRWSTEVRETYRLEPKWAAWKMAMIACAFSLAANLAIATYRHEVNPQNIESMGLGLAIAFCGICTWVSIWRKFVPNW